ncbi:hypothetical protein [Candidatus Electronema sp. PJ]|uniref:hypothetical protein n=1 Tax=Candidatus Electronema sp. PJ TaxID=3401572 RepID=UPI003AA8BBD6
MSEVPWKEKLLVPVVSIVLTGVVGSGLTVLFNHLDWKSRTKFEADKIAIENRRTEIKKIMALCQQRFFLSNMIYKYADESDYESVKNLDAEYTKVVRDWNFNLHINRLLLEQIFSPSVAEQFCDEDILKGDVKNSASVHSRFYLLGKEVGYVLKQIKRNEKPINLVECHNKLKDVGTALEDFYRNIIAYY